MTHHRLSFNQYLILAFVSVSVPLGDAALSRGMTSLPPISVAHPLSLIGAVFTPWIALGIALLIGYFASYLTALSWADLTFVMPATALGNVPRAAGALLVARRDLMDALDGDRYDYDRRGVCGTRAGKYDSAGECGCGCGAE